MSWIPLTYPNYNLASGTRFPNQVKYKNNASYEFWERSLFQRAMSAIEWEGWPENWDGQVRDFFYYCLFRFGVVGVFDRAETGLTFQPGTLYGQDLYYQPTEFIVANPALPDVKRLKINEECALIKLTPDYCGIWDIISYYAVKLSLLDTALDMSIINNKFAFFLAAKNKAAAKTLKKIFDKVNAGEPAVVYDTKLLNDDTDQTEPWQFWERKNLKESYLTTDQLQDFQTLINNFDSEIGIPSLPYQKAERMVTQEASMRTLDSVSRSTVWIRTLKASLETVNEMFKTDLRVKLRFDPDEMEGGADDGEADTDRPGAVEPAGQQPV